MGNVMLRTKFKINRNAVRKDTERQREEYRHSGAWLHNAVDFDSDLCLFGNNKILANILFDSLELSTGYKENQKQDDFEILLANLFSQTRKPIKISRNRNDYEQNNRYNKAGYFTIDLIDMLFERKLIDMEKGHNYKPAPRMTRIWAEKSLLELFPEYRQGVILKPKELVILKDGKGKLKPYKDTAETRRIRAILAHVNELNGMTDIKYHNYKLNAFLTAVFIERFTLYGRLHTRGFRHYQGFDKDERAEITINGDSTHEWDYCGLGPNLLYASIGRQYSGDPYSVIDDRPAVREFLKTILICLINAKDEITAEKAANNWLHENPTGQKALAKIGITKARPLIDRFMEVHQPISDCFCKGKKTGLKIMNKDSKIALDVIKHFADQKIPILAIHDSFIVQEKYQQELYKVMKAMYKKHTGFRIKVK
jgi:hypothetical protein